MTALERFLVVRLAGKEYAIPAARICGMMQMRGLQMEPLEGLGAMRYLASLHGRALPVYVPNRFLGLADHPVSARSCLLLIRGRNAGRLAGGLDAQAAECALVVDSISRLEEIPPALRRHTNGNNGAAASHVRLGEKWREVLDLERILAARGQELLSRTT